MILWGHMRAQAQGSPGVSAVRPPHELREPSLPGVGRGQSPRKALRRASLSPGLESHPSPRSGQGSALNPKRE